MNTTTHRKIHCGPLGTAVAVLLAAWSSTAIADDDKAAFRMMAIENTAQGDLVTAGRYEEAIEKITARRISKREFDKYNNLCVAYAKTRALYEAVVACETALEARKRYDAPSYFRSSYEKLQVRDRAVALSNRGVLRAVMGDKDGAREDFEASLALDADLEEPAENLALLAARNVAGM